MSPTQWKNKSNQAPIISEPQCILARDVLIELLQHELVMLNEKVCGGVLIGVLFKTLPTMFN